MKKQELPRVGNSPCSLNTFHCALISFTVKFRLILDSTLYELFMDTSDFPLRIRGGLLPRTTSLVQDNSDNSLYYLLRVLYHIISFNPHHRSLRKMLFLLSLFYKENSFILPTCITNTDWQKETGKKVVYKLNHTSLATKVPVNLEHPLMK